MTPLSITLFWYAIGLIFAFSIVSEIGNNRDKLKEVLAEQLEAEKLKNGDTTSIEFTLNNFSKVEALLSNWQTIMMLTALVAFLGPILIYAYFSLLRDLKKRASKDDTSKKVD